MDVRTNVWIDGCQHFRRSIFREHPVILDCGIKRSRVGRTQSAAFMEIGAGLG